MQGFELETIDAKGSQQNRRFPAPPQMQYGYAWEAIDTGTDDNVMSTTLVLKDLDHQRVLAKRRVFLFYSPEIKAFPSMWATPSPVQLESVRSCPGPLELVAFIKSVTPPSVSHLNSQ